MSHFEDETQPEPICAACNKPWPCPDAGIDGWQGHNPGDPHRYRITCEVCGEVGTLRVSVDPQNAEPRL